MQPFRITGINTPKIVSGFTSITELSVIHKKELIMINYIKKSTQVLPVLAILSALSFMAAKQEKSEVLKKLQLHFHMKR
jgi:hypothetical protein